MVDSSHGSDTLRPVPFIITMTLVILRSISSAFFLRYLLKDSMCTENYLLHPLFKQIFGNSYITGESFRWILVGGDFYTNFYRTFDTTYKRLTKIDLECKLPSWQIKGACNGYPAFIHNMVEICIITASFNYVLAPSSLPGLGKDYQFSVGIPLALLNYFVSRSFKHTKINKYLSSEHYASFPSLLRTFWKVRTSFYLAYLKKFQLKRPFASILANITFALYTIFALLILCATFGRNFYGTLHAIATTFTKLNPSEEIWSTGIVGKIVIITTALLTVVSTFNFLYSMLIPLLEITLPQLHRGQQGSKPKSVCEMIPKRCTSLLSDLLYIAIWVDILGQFIPSWSGNISLIVTISAIFGKLNSSVNNSIIAAGSVSAFGYIVCYASFNFKGLAGTKPFGSTCRIDNSVSITTQTLLPRHPDDVEEARQFTATRT